MLFKGKAIASGKVNVKQKSIGAVGEVGPKAVSVHSKNLCSETKRLWACRK